MRSQSHFTSSVLFTFDRLLHSETAAFFLISSLIRFYYEHFKVMFKNSNVDTLLECRYVLA